MTAPVHRARSQNHGSGPTQVRGRERGRLAVQVEALLADGTASSCLVLDATAGVGPLALRIGAAAQFMWCKSDGANPVVQFLWCKSDGAIPIDGWE